MSRLPLIFFPLRHFHIFFTSARWVFQSVGCVTVSGVVRGCESETFLCIALQIFKNKPKFWIVNSVKFQNQNFKAVQIGMELAGCLDMLGSMMTWKKVFENVVKIWIHIECLSLALLSYFGGCLDVVRRRKRQLFSPIFWSFWTNFWLFSINFRFLLRILIVFGRFSNTSRLFSQFFRDWKIQCSIFEGVCRRSRRRKNCFFRKKKPKRMTEVLHERSTWKRRYL